MSTSFLLGFIALLCSLVFLGCVGLGVFLLVAQSSTWLPEIGAMICFLTATVALVGVAVSVAGQAAAGGPVGRQ